MNKFIISRNNNQIWYDLKSDEYDVDNNIWCFVTLSNGQNFYIRPHREDGPAIIWFNGFEEYYIRGSRHCDYGPACISPFGYHYWYLDNKNYSFSDWCQKTGKSFEEINFLKLKWNII